MNFLKQNNAKENLYFTVFIVLLIIIIGAFIRFNYASTKKYPLNDGGLFYTMTQDVLDSGFALPVYTTYNGGNIPFAYPPLGFYVAALLSLVGKWSVLDILRIFPPFISTLTIPAFFRLSHIILKSDTKALFASFVFATITPTYDWFIMGGGLTRSLGFFFAILALYELYTLVCEAQVWRIFTGAILIGLTLLSHPGAILFLFYSIAFIMLFSKNRIHNFFKLAFAGLIAAVLSFPWWYTIILRFGVKPFFCISNAAFAPLTTLSGAIFLQFTFEPIMPIRAMIGLVGLLICLRDQKFFLVVWFFIIATLQGRAWQAYLQIPFCMLAGIGAEQIIYLLGYKNFPSLHHATVDEQKGLASIFCHMVPKIGLIYLVVICIISAYMAVPQDYLSPEQFSSMEWVSNNTPVKSKFVLIGGDTGGDLVNEWFPAISHRRSLTTAPGTEWTGEPLMSNHLILQSCTNQSVDCIDQWLLKTQNNIDYIYLTNSPNANPLSFPLLNSLKSSNEFKEVYSSTEVHIFAQINQ